MQGGHGGQGQSVIWKIRLLENLVIQATLGGNGANGEFGEHRTGGAGAGNHNQFITGGGSSGGNTILRLPGGTVLATAIGGAGGGGAAGIWE